MPHLEIGMIALFAIATIAAAVNGALGYGFSSLTVPVALLFFSNRLLSPAIIIIEVAINSWIVYLNRTSIGSAFRRSVPILVGLVPGILLGSLILDRVEPGWLKLLTYAVLLPLILLQAAGYRRPLRSEAAASTALGVGIGTLYATTTISGPPLALMLHNQALEPEEFRGALAIVRAAETIVAVAAYGWMGLFNAESLKLLTGILPAVLIGLPLGAFVVRRVPLEAFRRLCMSFNAWAIGFGLARILVALKIVGELWASGIWCAVIACDLLLLYRYFSVAANPAMNWDEDGEGKVLI